VAARTSKIKLGTGVLVLPLRNPVVTAKALGSLDVISGGRLVLGVAAGWYAREFDAVGVPSSSAGAFSSAIWTSSCVSGRKSASPQGRRVQPARGGHGAAHGPAPPAARADRGYVDAVLKRVATVGDGWLTYFYTPESFTKSWQKIHAFAKEAGRDPLAHLTNQLAIYVGRNREETEKDMRQWLSTEWDTAAWSESTIEHAIHGSAEQCIEQLRPT